MAITIQKKIWTCIILLSMHTLTHAAAQDDPQDKKSNEGLKILSYNICTEARTFDTELDLKHRLPAILKIIQTHNPDVICLQEVRLKVADIVAASLDKIGYTTSYIPNNDGPMSLGLMTAFNPEKLACDCYIPQWFCENPIEPGGNTWYQSNLFHAGRIFTLATVAGLRSIEQGENMAIINTHLGITEEEKEYSTRQLLAIVADFKHAILVGDMNFFDDKSGPAQRRMYTDAGMQDLLAKAHPTFVGYSYDKFIPSTKADMSKLDGAFVKGIKDMKATVLLYDELKDDLSNRDEQPSDHVPILLQIRKNIE